MGPMGLVGLIALMGLIEVPSAPAPGSESPFVFPVEPIREAADSAVVLVLGDLNSDRETDFVLVSDGGTVAYDHRGRPMWRCSMAAIRSGSGKNAPSPRKRQSMCTVPRVPVCRSAVSGFRWMKYWNRCPTRKCVCWTPVQIGRAHV